MFSVSRFVKDPNFISLCCGIGGIAILGYLGYHTVRWVANKCRKTEEIDCTAQAIIRKNEETTAAAIKLQSFLRGCSARIQAKKARKHLLRYDLLEKAKPYVNDPSKLQDVPQASSGKTPVYLPEELPIVLKESGFLESRKRFDQMKLARGVCEKYKYDDVLVIPKVRVCKNFIIEDKLPITMHGTKEQMGIYIENPKKFTDAIKAFTDFLCRSSAFYDITSRRSTSGFWGRSTDPYAALSKAEMPRYDNVVLYEEEGRGKIGLVDLEGFVPGYDVECPQGSRYSECLDAVHLFPYHFNEIMEVAKKFDPNIELHREELKKERDEALKRLELAYKIHSDFAQAKGITLENPIVFEELGAIRKEQLKNTIKEKLREASKDSWFKRCFDLDNTLTWFDKEGFQQILDTTYKIINAHLKYNMDRNEKPILSKPKLLSIRTLGFDSKYIEEQFEASISKELLEELKSRGPFETSGFLHLLFDTLVEELEKGKEIAHYNPKFRNHEIRLILC